MPWSIDKSFDVCYGHRVWTQSLSPSESENLPSACRHLHGHEARVVVHLAGDADEGGMVTDLRNLEWLKRWLGDNIDHKFLIDKQDPMLALLAPGRALVDVKVPQTDIVAGCRFDIADLDGPGRELIESFFVVDFVPTAERLSEWIFKIASERMKKICVRVAKVEWVET